MMTKYRWFDREFVFDSPVWMFPDIVERLRGTPARIEDSIRGLEQQIVVRRDADAWSILENIGHLLDTEPMWMGRLYDLLGGKQILRPADLENTATYQADYNSKSVDSVVPLFRKNRMQFIERLDQLEESDVLRSAIHPRLNKPMRTIDLALFVAEHDDHHLAQITRLKGLFLA